MLMIYSIISLLFLCRNQVGRNPAMLSGTTPSTKMYSIVSVKKVESAGSSKSTKGVAMQ